MEKRMLEKIETGVSKTAFMKPGDHIEIKMLSPKGGNIFGSISQKLKAVL